VNINYRETNMEFTFEFFNSLYQNLNSLTIEDWKNLSNIVFFISATLVAWLSYVAAKKSLLSPMKNEILKSQLDDIKEVFQFFKEEFDTTESINLSIKLLVTMYIDAAFKNGNRDIGECFIIKNNKLKDEIKEDRGPTIVPGESSKEPLESMFGNITDAKYWDENYIVAGVSLTKKFGRKLDALEKLTWYPLIPSELRGMLEDYEEKMSSLYVSIVNGLNDAKAKLNFKGDIPYEITNEKLNQLKQSVYNSVDESEMSIQAHKISEYMRGYLNVDKIMR
jgi:hypothetical protein